MTVEQTGYTASSHTRFESCWWI